MGITRDDLKGEELTDTADILVARTNALWESEDENRRLRAKLGHTQIERNALRAQLADAEARATKAERESVILREALQSIVDFEPAHPHIRSPYEQIAAWAKNSARESLAALAAPAEPREGVAGE